MSTLLDITKIPEMREMRMIDTVFDAIKLSEFVFSLIPHSNNKETLDVTQDLLNYYELFKEKKFFGWCHANALFLHILLREYGRNSVIYNYGIRENKFTHVVVILSIKGEEYLLDPYFNRYYVDEKNEPLTFGALLNMIKDNPTGIKSVYGKAQKEVEVHHAGSNDFVLFSPERLEQSVIGSWKTLEFDEVLLKEFNDINPILLISKKIQKTVLLTKRNGVPYYDFF